MNTEPITLSENHSRRLRALHHLASFMSLDELIEEIIFSCSPDNILSCINDSLEAGPERRRIEQLIFGNLEECFQGWDDLAERAGDFPAYDPADYPEPVYTPTNILAFKVIK